MSSSKEEIGCKEQFVFAGTSDKNVNLILNLLRLVRKNPEYSGTIKLLTDLGYIINSDVIINCPNLDSM